MQKLVIAIICFLLSSSSLIAQEQVLYGFLPSINLNKKLPKDWSVNLKVESRQEIYQSKFDYHYKVTESALGFAKKIGIRTKVTAGYQWSAASQKSKHRVFQQLSYIQPYNSFKLGHRLSFDETFEQGEEMELRLRYRISTEVPLSGQRLNIKEFFFKANNEYLNAIQSGYNLEIRTAAYIGYVYSPKVKIELGLDYRIDSFVHEQLQQNIWLQLNLYTRL